MCVCVLSFLKEDLRRKIPLFREKTTTKNTKSAKRIYLNTKWNSHGQMSNSFERSHKDKKVKTWCIWGEQAMRKKARKWGGKNKKTKIPENLQADVSGENTINK